MTEHKLDEAALPGNEFAFGENSGFGDPELAAQNRALGSGGRRPLVATNHNLRPTRG